MERICETGEKKCCSTPVRTRPCFYAENPYHPPPTPNQQRTQCHNVMTMSLGGNKLLFEGGAYDHIVIPNGQCDVTAVNIATAMMSPADR